MATISVTPDPVPAGETAEITVRLDPAESQAITFVQTLTDAAGQRWEEKRTFTRLDQAAQFGDATVDFGTLARADDGSDPLLRVYEWSRPA